MAEHQLPKLSTGVRFSSPALPRRGDLSLDVTLDDADGRRFDRLAGEHLGGRLALVILGQVVSAPEIDATGFEGHLTVSGLTLDEAARMKAALT